MDGYDVFYQAANSEKSQKLLTHPLVTTLLFEKWQKFAQYFFFLNLFVHVIFVLLLTTFSILTLSPGSETCKLPPTRVISCIDYESVTCEVIVQYTTTMHSIEILLMNNHRTTKNQACCFRQYRSIFNCFY